MPRKKKEETSEDVLETMNPEMVEETSNGLGDDEEDQEQTA